MRKWGCRLAPARASWPEDDSNQRCGTDGFSGNFCRTVGQRLQQMGKMTSRFFDDEMTGIAPRGGRPLPLRHSGLGALVIAALLAQAGPATAQTPVAFDPAPLQAAAQAGNATAQFQLGTLDYVGITVVQDYVGAVNLLKQSGAAGNAEAQCEAGFLYETGSFAQGPPPPDPADAAIWYKKSAAVGDPWGEFALAALTQAGQGVPKDAAKAAALFAQAAVQGVDADPSSFPLAQLQKHFYETAYQLTGQSEWTDTVSITAGGGQ